MTLCENLRREGGELKSFLRVSGSYPSNPKVSIPFRGTVWVIITEGFSVEINLMCMILRFTFE